MQKKYNIDLNLRDNNGRTPFHFACYFGQLQIVDILLKNSKQHKINVVSESDNGMDGQGYAEQEGHTVIVILIRIWKRIQSELCWVHHRFKIFDEIKAVDTALDEIQFQLENIE